MQRAQKRKASGSSKLVGNPLLQKFSYTRFTHEQIEHLFQVYHIILGDNPSHRAMIISAIQSMDMTQFEKLLQTIKFHPNNLNSETFIHIEQVRDHIPDSRDCLDILKETRLLLQHELEEWHNLKSRLEDIYLEEEIYWKHRFK